MTPQDVRERAFEKAVFGGYDMGSVHQFLDEVAAEWAATYKENAVLKSKLKVLAEKIEEYRVTDDAMRLALLSAQKISAEITADATAKSEAMLADANEQADAILKNAKRELADEEARLVEAKRSSAQFLEKMRVICTKQLDFLDALGDMKFGLPDPEPETYEEYADYAEDYSEEYAAEEYPEEYAEEYPGEDSEEYYDETESLALDDAVKSIEDSVARLSDDSAPDIDIESEMDDMPPADFPEEPTKLFDFKNELEGHEPSPRPGFKFDDLRFGDNYEKDN